MTESASEGWHVGEYGRLGWVETGIKAAAFLVAYTAFAHALDRSLHAPTVIKVGELALLGVAEAGLVVAVRDRLIEREITAMGFVLFNNAAHLGMLYALLAAPGPGGLLSVFCALMLAGEVTKIVWLRTTEFTVREVGPLVVQGIVVAYAVVYAVALVAWQLAT